MYNIVVKSYISFNPKIFGGKPVITGTRIPVSRILFLLRDGYTIEENVNNLDAVIKGEELTVSFNYKYIIDCFQSIDSDSISLSFFDSNRAVTIRGVGDKSFLYLVMPMNK